MLLIKILTAFLLAFTVAAVLTPVARLVLRKFRFWNARDSQHKRRIIRGGGVAIAAACTLCGYVLYFFSGSSVLKLLNGFMPAALLLLLTGLIDDKWGVRAKPKLFLQALSVLLLWFGGYQVVSLLGYQLSWFWSLAATLLWGVAILNAFNLIDGLDGLCTGNSLICAFVFLIMATISGSSVMQLLSTMFAGACLGFLIFNIHPAKLFLGDTGSLFLGLSCAALSLKISGGNFNFHNTTAFLLVFWIPFCDLGLAVWRRKVKSLLRNSGCKIMTRDMYHLHYRLLNMTQRHGLTVLLMWLGMVVFDIVAMVIFIYRSEPLSLTLFIGTCLFSLATLAQYELRYSYCLVKCYARRFWERRREFALSHEAFQKTNLIEDAAITNWRNKQ